MTVVEVIEAAQLSLAQDRKVLLSEIAEGGRRLGSIPVPRRGTANTLTA